MSTYSEWDQRQLDIEGGLDDDKFRAAYSRKQAEAKINLECLQLVNDLRRFPRIESCAENDYREYAERFDYFVVRARRILGDSND